MIKFMDKYNNLGKTLIVLVFLITLLLVIMGITYAYWSTTVIQKETNQASGGCISVNIVDESESIYLPNSYPMTEEEAMTKDPYTFTVKNTCTANAYYIITLNTTGTEDLDQYIKYKIVDTSNNNNHAGPYYIKEVARYDEYNDYLYKKSSDDPGYLIKNSYILKGGWLRGATMDAEHIQVLHEGESTEYSLYLWLDENMEMEEEGGTTMGKSFEGKIIVVSATQDLGDEATGMY